MKSGIRILVTLSLVLLGLPIIFLAFITCKHTKPSEYVNLIIENSQENRLPSYTPFPLLQRAMRNFLIGPFKQRNKILL